MAHVPTFFWVTELWILVILKKEYKEQNKRSLRKSICSLLQTLKCNHNLHSVLLLQVKIFLVEGVNSINHDLDKLHLRVSKTVLVGDVISAASLATRFSTCSTGLDSKCFTASLELVNRLLGPAREVNMDGGTHTSSKIGGAGVDESVLFRESKVLATLSLDRVSNSLDTTSKTSQDTLDITALLHGDDSHLILLIDPEKEGLGSVVEYSTALWPITLHTSNSEVTVSTDKEEVIINKLLTDSFIHTSKRIVVTSKIIGKLAEGTAHQLLNINTLLLGDSGGETESINATTNTDTGGVDWSSGINISSDLVDIHVRSVLGIRADSMVVLDDSIEDLGEVLVAIPISSIDTAVLVVKFNSTGASLGNGEATGLGLDILDFVPSLLGHVLGDQGVLGLDFGEFS